MPVESVRFGERHVWHRTDSDYRKPKINTGFGDGGRTVDKTFTDRLYAYEKEVSGYRDADNFYRDPSSTEVPTRSSREADYRQAIVSLMPTQADKTAIHAREDDFANARWQAGQVRSGLNSATKLYHTNTAVGHTFGGILAIPTLGFSIAASTAAHGAAYAALNAEVRYLGSDIRSKMIPNAEHNAYQARLARESAADKIVQKYGERGRTYIEDSARLSDNCLVNYRDAWKNLGGTPFTVKEALNDAGVPTPGFELELARMAEVHIASPYTNLKTDAELNPSSAQQDDCTCTVM